VRRVSGTHTLERLVGPDTRGDPESPLRWTIKSTRELSRTLAEHGHPASEWLVRRLLRDAGYSLQAAAQHTNPPRPQGPGPGRPGSHPQLANAAHRRASHTCAAPRAGVLAPELM
jgi:Rhodopirellula transposase DDE domain